MLEGFKSWIITICSVVIFIYCIELLLPNNSLRKYAKFTTGLILMVVIINPFLKFFDSNFDLDAYTSKAEKYLEDSYDNKDYEKFKNSNQERTMETVCKNLEITYGEKLKDIYKDNDFDLKIEAKFNEENQNIEICKVNIEMKNKGVMKVKKIIIGKEEEVPASSSEDPKALEIKKFISEELNIDSKHISIY